MRIIANLVTLSASISEAAVVVDDVGSSSFGLAERPQFVELSLRLICAEEIGCRRWNYLAEKDGARKFKRNSFVLFLCRVLKLLLSYQKAFHMIYYADHHGFPIVTFIDTPDECRVKQLLTI
ncbi:protein root UVB sensitive 6-like isoform X2 [Mangifera indica]|uniref:protein root UVB sensitive 6-like isoform X2 n=1 Tax=Mangifera indica TaxID=29780 RepID=UPI001CFBEF17|nr:protein root UVB sensitive 6-like isoform X2 [Mangifera indica]